MNEQDEKRIEDALRGLSPAQPPDPFMARLAAASPVCQRPRDQVPRRGPVVPWLQLARWLVPSTALVTGALVAWRLSLAPAGLAVATPAFKADDVQIDRELLSAFDAVGQLPSGEPVRFRCQEWRDTMELRDTARGVVVQQSAPRLEVVPVSFETY